MLRFRNIVSKDTFSLSFTVYLNHGVYLLNLSRLVFDDIRAVGLKLKPTKCLFLSRRGRCFSRTRSVV